MALPPIYSRRKMLAEKAGDVFQYEEMSEKLNNQILLIFEECCEYWASKTSGGDKREPYRNCRDFFRKELGEKSLTETVTVNAQREFENWFSYLAEVENQLDAIEIMSALIGNMGLESTNYNRDLDAYHDFFLAAGTEINERMMEDQFGYQIEDGQIIRVDSNFAHKEIIIPALAILSETKYATANKEFRDAHQLYRQKDYRKAIHQCGNAFESVLKVISDERGWELDADKTTASKYLDKVFEDALIPNYIQGELTGLAAVLKSGVATIRNKAGGHGEGKNQKPIPKHIAAFQIHQTAAAILMLAEASQT